MTERELTADDLERIFHAALKAGDARGVDGALRCMIPLDPERADRLLNALDRALRIALPRSEDG